MTTNTNISFVTDASGNKHAVLIPLNEWEAIQKDLKELFEYRTMKLNLKSALTQVQQMKEGKLPKKSLKTFLDEC